MFLLLSAFDFPKVEITYSPFNFPRIYSKLPNKNRLPSRFSLLQDKPRLFKRFGLNKYFNSYVNFDSPSRGTSTMHHDYFWYYVAIAAGVLLLLFKFMHSRRKQDYYYHPGQTYYPDEVQNEYSFYDGQGGHRSQTRSHADFSFFERRFMNEIDNVLAACQRADEEERWEDAEAYARSALRKVDRNLGRDHWYAVHALAWLGHLSYRDGRYSEAREYFEKAVCIGKEWYSKVAPDLLRIEKDLAKCTDLLGF